MNVLGISAYFHDSACAIIKDGEVLYAAQEERFSRVKYDSDFPIKAINNGLKELNLKISDIDEIVYHEKPLLKFNRILESYIENFPRGFKSFSMSMPKWLNQKIFTEFKIKKQIHEEFGHKYKESIRFSKHHLSHAASCFYPSPFYRATIVTADSLGEWSTTTIGYGEEDTLNLIKEMHYPHSLGLLYTTFTQFLGFQVYSGEAKLMGLAAYGEPVYKDRIYNHLLTVHDDFSFTLDKSYFYFDIGNIMFSPKFEALFKGLRRSSSEEITQEHKNLAASIQVVLEEMMIGICNYAYEIAPCENLVMAGGIALNCVANTKILNETPFKKLWIQPAAGDAGCAIGSALYFYYSSTKDKSKKIFSPYLGNAYTKKEIENTFKKFNVSYTSHDQKDLLSLVAKELSEGKTVGWFQGKMEFGPRALGNRSILADPRGVKTRDLINGRIKFREDFRPFAPAVMKEYCNEIFEEQLDSSYMLFTNQVKHSDLPAITHINKSARIQTVSKEENNLFYHLLEEFYSLTKTPVLLNTSFNLNNEPIVCSPEDALRSFFRSELDLLVVENFVIRKKIETYKNNAIEENFKGDDFDQKIRSFYETHPFPLYGDIKTYADLVNRGNENIFSSHLLDSIGFNKKILECGCGTGQLANYLQLNNNNVHAIDSSSKSLSIAQRFKEQNEISRSHFYHMNIFDMSFENESFDVAISMGVLHHTKDARLGFSCMVKKLKSEGYIVIGLYNKYARLINLLNIKIYNIFGIRVDSISRKLKNKNKKESWFFDQYKNPHEKRFSIDEVMNWFEEENIEYINCYPQILDTNEKDLFVKSSKGNLYKRLWTQIKWMFSISSEGSLFVVVGKKK